MVPGSVRTVYIVLDTESSLCRIQRRRVLVSLAYEVLVHSNDGGHTVEYSGYDIIQPEMYTDPDPASVNIHHIQSCYAYQYGRPLVDVLQTLGAVTKKYQPTAIVGHDITNDVVLLISEAMRCGISQFDCLGPVAHLICTKLLSTGPCAIPIPKHLCYRYPCDAVIEPNTTDMVSGVLKWPNLEESYHLLVGDTSIVSDEQFQEHDARGDVARCRAIFEELVLRDHVADP